MTNTKAKTHADGHRLCGESVPNPQKMPFLGIDDSGNMSVARRLSDVREEETEWLVANTIPKHTLTLVVGMPGTGKSTFGAWLTAKAKTPGLIPGSEESVKAALRPRMAAAGVDLDRAILLDGRQWTLPRDRLRLAQVITDGQIDFLWIDPIDGFMGEESENDGPRVRAMLESLHRIAENTKCTVVAARHPGKAVDNICPGSRQWRAVPRVIIKLAKDSGPPVRRFLSVFKSFQGGEPLPREFAINRVGKSGVFELGKEVTEADASTGDVLDRIDRCKIDEAQALIVALLADGEQTSTAVHNRGEQERLGERLMRRAAERIGVQYRREGVGVDHRVYWSMPVKSADDKSGASTPDTATHTPPPLSQADVRSEVESITADGNGRISKTDSKPKKPRKKKGGK